jgi:hypothetical protein
MKPSIDSNLASRRISCDERLTFRFRMEATNVLNHFNYLTARFNTTSTTRTSDQFPGLHGFPGCTPRIVQFGIKASW